MNPWIQKHTSSSWPGAELGHPEGPLAQSPRQGQAWSLCCLYSISQLPQAGWTPANAKLSSLPIPGKKFNRKPFPLALRPGLAQDNLFTAADRSVAQGLCKEEVTAAVWHLGGRDVPFLGALGSIPFPDGAAWARWKPKFNQH